MTRWHRIANLTFAGFVLAAGCAASAPEKTDARGQALAQVRNQVIVDWNVHTEDASTAQSPPRRARTYAMVFLAVHDALNGIEPNYGRYASTATDAEASPVAAAAQAAHDVLLAIFPSQQADLDAKLAASLGPIHDDEAKARGIALGQSAAAAMIAVRANDGSAAVVVFTPTFVPGHWRPTPPAFAPALEPGWPFVTPFAMRSQDQFRAPPPYPITSAQYTADFVEARDYGRNTSTVRSADQTHYAHFWYEPSPVAWNRLARMALAAHPKNIWKAGRLFALINMAMADGYLASFETKYAYQSWRPITAIREADTDGNPDTDADPTWTPLRPTPPMPDQTSGHAVEGFAARAGLVEIFGDAQDQPLTMTTTTAVPAGSTRSWSSFSEAAAENADSRVMVGIHTRQSVVDGEAQGRAVGALVVQNFLRPLDD